jgi:transcriptional regulator with PAS, ATPase and Fis domain
MERLIDSVAARRRRAAAAREAGLRDRVARAAVELFDQLYEGAVLIDAAGTVLWMNDKYRAILGWNGMDPVEGRPVEDIIPNSRLREVVASGRADLIDIFEVEGRQLVVSRIPLKDEDGRVSGAVGMILYAAGRQVSGDAARSGSRPPPAGGCPPGQIRLFTVHRQFRGGAAAEAPGPPGGRA